MLGAKDSGWYASLVGIGGKIDLQRLIKRFLVEVIRYRDELNRPPFNHDANIPEFGVTSLRQKRQDWRQHRQPGLSAPRNLLERHQNIQVLGESRFDIVVGSDRTAYGVPSIPAVSRLNLVACDASTNRKNSAR